MANLLEEASILLTPTAYNDGKMLSVKPNENLLGSELVANGDFSTDSVWVKDANWSIANGKATSTGAGRMFQSIPFLETNIGSKVVVSFDIVDYTSGGVVIQCYGSSSETFTGVGTHTFETVTTNTLNLYINNSGQGNLVGSIDNVSIKVDLSGDFIFTRNSAATRVNAQGLVDSVSENLPRINYEGGCGSWLLEPQSTNTMTTSEPITNNSYKTGVVFQQTNIYSWNGIYYGDNSERRVAFFNTPTEIGIDITFSVFVKMTNGNAPKVGTSPTDDFKMYIGSVLEVGSIVDIGGGVYRCSITRTTAVENYLIAVEKTTSNSANTFEISGFQVEQGLFSTSYIPTNGAASTRLRDLSGNSGNTSLINSTEGVLYVDFAAYSTQNTREITLSDGTSSNRIIISYNSNNRLDVNLYTSGGYQAIFNYTGISDSTAFNKIAFKYKENDCSLWVNGVEVGVDTNAPIMPIGLDILNLASSNGATNIMYGKVNALAVFKTALTDEQLTALTTL